MKSSSIGSRPNYSCRSIRSPQRGITSRKTIERREAAILSPRAMQSQASDDRGVWLGVAKRGYPLDVKLIIDLPVHSIFAEDREKINNSNAFRRLAGKTQVLIKPTDETITTRLTHTIQVAQYARTAGRALGLNEDLIEAIALGHDLGHTPFGHAGERALNDLAEEHPGSRYSFSHNRNSFRLGSEWGLSHEVLDGILRHSGKIDNRVIRPSPMLDSLHEDFTDPEKNPMTLEGCLVKVMDKVVSAAQDFFDLFHAGMIRNDNAWHLNAISAICKVFRLGKTSIGHPHILHQALLADIIENSAGKESIIFSPRGHIGFSFLQEFIDGIVRGKIIDDGQKHIKGDLRMKLGDEKVNHIIRAIFGKQMQEFIDGVVRGKIIGEGRPIREDPRIKLEDEKAIRIIRTIFERRIKETGRLPKFLEDEEILDIIENIALMTDRMAIEEFDKITRPGTII